MWLTLLLLGRVVLSTCANTLQKRLTLQAVRSPALWRATYAWMAPLALLVLAVSFTSSLSREFWLNAALSGLIDALGNLAMVAALSTTDLSVFGPLNGFRPVLALIFGWLFLGEQVSWLGSVGVGLTVVGASLLLRDPRTKNSPWTMSAWRTLGWRLLGLSLSTFAAVFLKRAVLLGSPANTLGVWILCGLPVCWFGFRHQPAESIDPAPANRQPRLIFAHALIFFLMQWLTLLVFRSTPLAYSFAFFQLGMVLQVLVGYRYFGESQPGWRLACCALIGLGSALILFIH